MNARVPSGTIFGRIIVGVDGSPEALAAARQAAALVEDGGQLTLVAVYDIAPAIVGGTGTGTPAYFDEDVQRSRAEEALERARRAVADAVEPVGEVTRGRAADELIRHVADDQHTLIAVGSHGVGRVRGTLIGSTATELIHKAPCSVLVARGAAEQFPKRIVVGIDDSPHATRARSVAEYLAGRFAADLRPVTAEQKPADELVASAADADLVVVGSRGMHGLKSLGSVSERVAHRAPCSVLIVRERPASKPG